MTFEDLVRWVFLITGGFVWCGIVCLIVASIFGRLMPGDDE